MWILFSIRSILAQFSIKRNGSNKPVYQDDDFSIQNEDNFWHSQLPVESSETGSRNLYASGSISDADRIDSIVQSYNAANGSARPFTPSEFYGWLLQSAYTIWQKGDMTISPFLHFSIYSF